MAICLKFEIMKKLLVFFIAILSLPCFAQRISELPAATTINSGDLMLTVQGGVTKKVEFSVISNSFSFLNDILWAKSSNYVFLKDQNDNVGIGISNPSTKLDVDGNINAYNFNTIGSNTKIGIDALNSITTGGFNTATGFRALYSNTTGNYNTATGWRSLYLNTIGTHNTATGYRALYSNTTGTINTATGFQALYSNTAGSYNTAGGYNALYFNSTGIANTSIGFNSLYSNTTGRNNAAVGYASLYLNTTGEFNIGIGYEANSNNQTGSQNTIIGARAGKGSSMHDKSGCVFLGYNAGFYEMGSNKLYIENSNSSSPLIYGEFDNDILAVNGKVGIGTTTPSERLDVDGNINIPLSTSSEGIIMQDGTRFLHSYGLHNTFVGYGSGNFSITGSQNTGIGYGTLEDNSSGTGNTAIGYRALANNTTGTNNFAMGSASLESNTTGYRNVIIGYQSFRYSTASSHNTAVGYEAGENSSSTGSVFLGYGAGYDEDRNYRLEICNNVYSPPLLQGDFANPYLLINGNLDINGSFGTRITEVSTTPYSTSGSQSILHVTRTETSAVTITLDSDDVDDGKWILIKDASGHAGTYNITVQTEGSETIDGASTATISSDWGGLIIYSDGSNWFVLKSLPTTQ